MIPEWLSPEIGLDVICAFVAGVVYVERVKGRAERNTEQIIGLDTRLDRAQERFDVLDSKLDRLSETLHQIVGELRRGPP